MTTLYEECKTEKTRLSKLLISLREESSMKETKNDRLMSKMRIEIRNLEEKVMKYEGQIEKIRLDDESR